MATVLLLLLTIRGERTDDDVNQPGGLRPVCSVSVHDVNATDETRSVPVTKPGRFPDLPESPIDTSDLGTELKRLRRSGLSDLALRPERYPALTALFTSNDRQAPTDKLRRLDFNSQMFDAVLAQLPSEQLQRAASILFHSDTRGAPPPLDHRRRAADRAYTGKGHAREPDTVQRYLERDLLDPLLIEALRGVAARPPATDLPTNVDGGYEAGLREDGIDRAIACLARRDVHGATTALNAGFARPRLDEPGRVAQPRNPQTALGPEIDEMNRRTFLRGLSAAGTLAAAPPLESSLDWERIASIGHRFHRVDATAIRELAALNSRLWRSVAASKSKNAVLSLARAHLEVLADALQRPHGAAIHRQLCALLGDLFQLTGEVFFDANRYDDAAHCYTVAASVSKDANAYDLWACALTRHAFICVYEQRFDKAMPMLELARRLAAKGDSNLSTRHWVSAVMAQALAGLGDLSACQESMTSAAQVTTLVGQVHNGGWLRFDGSRLAEEQGSCYVKLGQPDLAEPALTAALRQTLSARRRGGVLTDLAMVGIQRHELDQVIAHGVDAVRVAQHTASGVVRRKLQHLQTHLSPFLSDRRIRTLDQQISSLEETRTTVLPTSRR